MNNKPIVSESLLGGAILIALILLLNPFNAIMASALTLSLLMTLAVAMIAFAVFIWREKPRDEREAFYGLQAGHVSFFVGAGVLVLAIIVEVFQHNLNVWLPATLGTMVITKLIVSAWMRQR